MSSQEIKSRAKPEFDFQVSKGIEQILVGPCPCGKGFIVNKEAEPLKIIQNLTLQIEQLREKYEKKSKWVKLCWYLIGNLLICFV